MSGKWVKIGKAFVAGKQRMENSLDYRNPNFVLVSALAQGRIRARGRKTTFQLMTPGFISEEGQMVPSQLYEWGSEISEVVEIPREFWSSFVILEQRPGIVFGFNCAFDFRLGGFGIGDVGYLEVEILSGIKSAAGRKPKFDWDAFVQHTLEKLDFEGGFHEGFRKADAERSMAQWCMMHWGCEPSEASIRRYVTQAEVQYLMEKRLKAQN